jgi:hypothetical protein
MNKVYIVLTGYDYEGYTDIVGVFDSYAKAAALADKLQKKADKAGFGGYAEIMERVIQ